MRTFWSVAGAAALGAFALLAWFLTAAQLSRDWSGWASWVLFAVLFGVAVLSTAGSVTLLVRAFTKKPNPYSYTFSGLR